MEVGVICRVRAFTLCQDAAESWGVNQLPSFGIPWLWQILPTAVQHNQDEKPGWSGGRLSAWNSLVLSVWAPGEGELGWHQPLTPLPCTGTGKADVAADLWTRWPKADWLLVLHVLFPISIWDTYKRDYKISYWTGIPLIKMQKIHIKHKTQAEKGFLHVTWYRQFRPLKCTSKSTPWKQGNPAFQRVSCCLEFLVKLHIL